MPQGGRSAYRKSAFHHFYEESKFGQPEVCLLYTSMGVLEVEKFRQLKERNQKATEQFYRKVGMGHGTQAGS